MFRVPVLSLTMLFLSQVAYAQPEQVSSQVECISLEAIQQEFIVVAHGERVAESQDGITVWQEMLVVSSNDGRWRFYLGRHPRGENGCLRIADSGIGFRTNDFRQDREPTIPIMQFNEDDAREECNRMREVSGMCGAYNSSLARFANSGERIAMTGISVTPDERQSDGDIRTLITIIASTEGGRTWRLLDTMNDGATTVLSRGRGFEWSDTIRMAYDRRAE